MNEFPTTRLTPLRISKLRKGSHLTTPFLEAKDGEQGARAAYPKANPATKAPRCNILARLTEGLLVFKEGYRNENTPEPICLRMVIIERLSRNKTFSYLVITPLLYSELPQLAWNSPSTNAQHLVCRAKMCVYLNLAEALLSLSLLQVD